MSADTSDNAVLRNRLEGRAPADFGDTNDRIFVRFSLAGTDLVPSAVSRELELEPDETWDATDLWRTGQPVGQGIWVLTSSLSPSAGFEWALDTLLARMRPAWVPLRRLSRRYGGAFEVGVHFSGAQGPQISVRRDVTEAIADLGASLELDIYVAPDVVTGNSG